MLSYIKIKSPLQRSDIIQEIQQVNEKAERILIIVKQPPT